MWLMVKVKKVKFLDSNLKECYKTKQISNVIMQDQPEPKNRTSGTYHRHKQDIVDIKRRVELIEHDLRTLILRFDNFLVGRQDVCLPRFSLCTETKTNRLVRSLGKREREEGGKVNEGEKGGGVDEY